MFRAQIIGNLGADAHIELNGGRPFVSFNVAHNDRYTREDGTQVERQQWVSCALNGDGGKLLQFLTKGRAVYVEGRCSVRVFSSEKERRMVAGVNISVDHVELIGGQSDPVPSRLFDEQGIMHNVSKSYWIDNNEAESILFGRKSAVLMTPSGQRFTLTPPCWVSPEVSTSPNQENNVGDVQAGDAVDEPFNGENVDGATVEMQQTVAKKTKKK